MIYTNKPLQPHQQRVLNEYTELSDKIAKLRAFLSTDMFKSLPTEEQDLLTKQLSIMDMYQDVLAERMTLWK